jgi:hypothetical protein
VIAGSGGTSLGHDLIVGERRSIRKAIFVLRNGTAKTDVCGERPGAFKDEYGLTTTLETMTNFDM